MARRKTIADADAAEAARFLEGATVIGPLDPVDAAIASHRAAWTELSVIVEKSRKAKFRSELFNTRLDAIKLYEARTDVLVETPLMTMAHVLAFTAYIASLEAYGPRPDPYPYQIEIGPLADAMANVAGALVRLAATPDARAPLALAA